MRQKRFINMVSKTCEECGEVFNHTKRNNVSVNHFLARKFCGRGCSDIALSKFRKLNSLKPSMICLEKAKQSNTGERSYRWKGGVSKVVGYYTHKALERYARLRGATGTFTLQQWLDLKKKHKHCCAKCGVNEMFAKITKDHIIPLSKGGSNNISNIQPLCGSCNSKKYNKLEQIYA